MKHVDLPKNNLLYNASGYADPTAYQAIKNVDNPTLEESDRFHNLLDTIKYITELAGFEIEGHVVLKDLETGRVWR